MLAFIGAITFFEGLIAIIRDDYYVVTRQQVRVRRLDMGRIGAVLGSCCLPRWGSRRKAVGPAGSRRRPLPQPAGQLSFPGNGLAFALVADDNHA
jgi:hypothetical protein